MPSDLDQHLQSQLTALEETFYDALLQGESALDAFHENWASLSSTIASSTAFLSVETLDLAHSVSRTIALVASHYIELDETAQQLSRKLAQDTQAILDDDSRPGSPHPDSTNTTPPSYVELAYEWLLSNLHNPYPTKKVKRQISTQCHCLEKDIDAWFVDIRRRIGWNKIRKMLNNKRDAAVAAASQFLGEAHTQVPLDQALVLALSRMRHTAQTLYSKHTETSLIRELDDAELVSSTRSKSITSYNGTPPATPPDLVTIPLSPSASCSESDECYTPVLSVTLEPALHVLSDSLPIMEASSSSSALLSLQRSEDYGLTQPMAPRKRKRRLSELNKVEITKRRCSTPHRQVAAAAPVPNSTPSFHSRSEMDEVPELGNWFASGVGSGLYPSAGASDTLDVQLFDYGLYQQTYINNVQSGSNSIYTIDPLHGLDLLSGLPVPTVTSPNILNPGLLDGPVHFPFGFFDQNVTGFPLLDSYIDPLQGLDPSDLSDFAGAFPLESLLSSPASI